MAEQVAIIHVSGRVRVPISVPEGDVEKARELAAAEVGEMDFGPLEDIEWDVVRVD